jgi:hypothetical protein
MGDAVFGDFSYILQDGIFFLHFSMVWGMIVPSFVSEVETNVRGRNRIFSE